MTTPAAIQGDYTDLKFVKGRKVAQIVLEIPIEAAGAFVEAFGTPNPATGIPVAIARIQPSALKQQLRQSVEIEREKDKEHRDWNECRPSMQAALRADQPAFWQFLNERCGQRVSCKQDAETATRSLCRVNTRAEFDRSDEKRRLWSKLDSDFQTWEMAKQVGAA